MNNWQQQSLWEEVYVIINQSVSLFTFVTFTNHIPAFVPSTILKGTVRSHPRLFPTAEVRSSSTHSSSGLVSDSDTVMLESTNTSLPVPVLNKTDTCGCSHY